MTANHSTAASVRRNRAAKKLGLVYVRGYVTEYSAPFVRVAVDRGERMIEDEMSKKDGKP